MDISAVVKVDIEVIKVCQEHGVASSDESNSRGGQRDELLLRITRLGRACEMRFPCRFQFR